MGRWFQRLLELTKTDPCGIEDGLTSVRGQCAQVEKSIVIMSIE